jgi:hypothetical protein
MEEKYQENPNKTNKDEMDPKDKDNIYYTHFHFNILIFFIICFILCSLISVWFFIIYLDGNESFLYYSIIPLIILLFITIITSFYPLFSKIVVDITNNLITIVHIKILFCLNKYLYIKFDDIEMVSIEKNTKVNYKINGDNYDAYNLIFKIKKDKKIIAMDSEIDNNFESQKLFEFLRDELPKNIPVSSDLITINELYPNIKTNRVMSSSNNNSYIKINKVQGNTALDFE